MHDDDLAVSRQLDVQLQSISTKGETMAKGQQSVLGSESRTASMGKE